VIPQRYNGSIRLAPFTAGPARLQGTCSTMPGCGERVNMDLKAEAVLAKGKDPAECGGPGLVRYGAVREQGGHAFFKAQTGNIVSVCAQISYPWPTDCSGETMPSARKSYPKIF